MPPGPPNLDELLGQRCWHVSVGGVTTPTFVMAFGDPVPRSTPLTNAQQPQLFRTHRGSCELLVWSPWRILGREGMVRSSVEDDARVVQIEGLLVGLHPESIQATSPAWDLTVAFSNGLELQVLSVGMPDSQFEGANWEIWTPTRHICAGPGFTLSVAASPDER